MRIAIPNEIASNEHRVAMVPQLVPALAKLGCTILFEKGAGDSASFPDVEYEGVEFIDTAKSLYEQADIVLKVQPPTLDEINAFKSGSILIGLLSPHESADRIEAYNARGITSFAMEKIPRISRAQAMDALSSQATVAGYKAALMASNLANRFFPMLTTAAGTIRPSQVLVIGAGVAGLQAIATAKRLGAIVKAYDIRSAAREQIESLGASMINIDVKAEASGGYARELSQDEKERQQAALSAAVKQSDVLILTAMIPGKPAPIIITKTMVESMRPGSVIIDVAAIGGGNCELTSVGETITHQGVFIDGPLNLPSLVARDASTMYAKNLISFLSLIVKDDSLNIDWDDPILKDSVLTSPQNADPEKERTQHA